MDESHALMTPGGVVEHHVHDVNPSTSTLALYGYEALSSDLTEPAPTLAPSNNEDIPTLALRRDMTE